MRNIIKIDFNRIMAMVFCFLIIFQLVYPVYLDRIFLMEEGNHSFWKIMKMRSPYKLTVVPSLEDKTDHAIITNERNVLRHYKLLDGNYKNIHVHQEGDDLLFDGQTDDKQWFSITKERIRLDDGDYYISAGAISRNMFVYLQGYNGKESKIIATQLGNSLFSIIDKEFPNGFQFGTAIEADSLIEGERIKPVLIELPSAEKKNANSWFIEKKEWEELSEHEKKVVENRVRCQFGGASWDSIIFDDGTGIQFVDGERKEGEVNQFGYVVGGGL